MSNEKAEAQAKLTKSLTQSLAVGSVITCTGTPTDDIPWFAINIGCGNPDDAHRDMAVHFNVRQPASYVVRNTRHVNWGPEETRSYRCYPFKALTQFTIEIVVEKNQTLWSVNGHHYCSYAHREPTPFEATWVQVTGIRDAAIKVLRPEVECYNKQCASKCLCIDYR